MALSTLNEVNHLIVPQPPIQRYPIPDAFKGFISELVWDSIVSLEANIKPHFDGLVASLEADLIQWKKWYGEEKPEIAPLPKDMRDSTKLLQTLTTKSYET